MPRHSAVTALVAVSQGGDLAARLRGSELPPIPGGNWTVAALCAAFALLLLLSRGERSSDSARLLGIALVVFALYLASEQLGFTNFGLPW